MSRSSLLPSPTRNRPRPPEGRRLPTKASLRRQQQLSEGEEEAGEVHLSAPEDIDPVWEGVGVGEGEGADEERPLVLSVASAMIASSTPIVNSEVRLAGCTLL